jgi:4-hydroxy-2-oxoheptanedioate aldolase
MSDQEFKCVSILNELIESYGLIGIKVSFEDEGASFNEVIRLKELCNQAQTKLTLKIGGPEATRDIKDSLVIGTRGIVAPMVESAFGLEKFICSINNNLPKSIIDSLHLGINIETITGIENAESIMKSKYVKNLNSITIGRVDLVKSIGKDRDFVNDDKIFSMIKNTFRKAKEANLLVNVGGAISIDSKDFLIKLFKLGLLDRFETRYVIYNPNVALKNLSKSLEYGQKFEHQ